MNSFNLNFFGIRNLSLIALLLISLFPIDHKSLYFYVLNFVLLLIAGFDYKKINVNIFLLIIFFYFYLFIKVILFDQNYSYNSYFYSQINHFIQIPIYIYLWINVIRNKSEIFLFLFKENYFLLYVIFLTSCFYHLHYFGHIFNDFNLFYILILLSFFINYKRKDYIYFILFLVTPFFFNLERLSFIIILLLIFVDRSLFINSNFRKFFYMLIILVSLCIPYLILFFYSSDLVEFFHNYDGNISLRIEMINSGFSVFLSNISNIIFGVPFGETFRSPNFSSANQVPHLRESYLLLTVPNHNSMFDLFFRFGLFGAFFLFYITVKILSSRFKNLNDRANILCLFEDSKGKYGEVYNVACGETLSINGLFMMIKKSISGILDEQLNLLPKYAPDRPGDIKDSLANLDKIKIHFGYIPKIYAAEGIDKTCKWHISNRR